VIGFATFLNASMCLVWLTLWWETDDRFWFILMLFALFGLMLCVRALPR
jgi:hypothetical protein